MNLGQEEVDPYRSYYTGREPDIAVSWTPVQRLWVNAVNTRGQQLRITDNLVLTRKSGIWFRCKSDQEIDERLPSYAKPISNSTHHSQVRGSECDKPSG